MRSIRHSEKTDHPVYVERTILASEILEGPVIINEIRLGLKFKKICRKDIQNVNVSSSDSALFDWDCLRFPLKLRQYRRGDAFIPLGMTGSQSLKKFFVNNKIRKQKRLEMPIVLSENKIIWVVGERISDPVKVTPETKTVLCAEVFKLPKDMAVC